MAVTIQLIENKEFKLKDGRTAVLKNPGDEEVMGMLEYLYVHGDIKACFVQRFFFDVLDLCVIVVYRFYILIRKAVITIDDVLFSAMRAAERISL